MLKKHNHTIENNDFLLAKTLIGYAAMKKHDKSIVLPTSIGNQIVHELSLAEHTKIKGEYIDRLFSNLLQPYF